MLGSIQALGLGQAAETRVPGVPVPDPQTGRILWVLGAAARLVWVRGVGVVLLSRLQERGQVQVQQG